MHSIDPLFRFAFHSIVSGPRLEGTESDEVLRGRLQSVRADLLTPELFNVYQRLVDRVNQGHVSQLPPVSGSIAAGRFAGPRPDDVAAKLPAGHPPKDAETF